MSEEAEKLVDYMNKSQAFQIPSDYIQKLDIRDKAMWLCFLHIRLVRCYKIKPNCSILYEIPNIIKELLENIKIDVAKHPSTSKSVAYEEYFRVKDRQKAMESEISRSNDYCNEEYESLVESQLSACANLLKNWLASQREEQTLKFEDFEDTIRSIKDVPELLMLEEAMLDLSLFHIRYLRNEKFEYVIDAVSNFLYPSLSQIHQILFKGEHRSLDGYTQEKLTDVLWRARFNFAMEKIKNMVISFLVPVQLEIIGSNEKLFEYVINKLMTILEEIVSVPIFKPSYPNKHHMTPTLICRQLFRLEKYTELIYSVCGERKKDPFNEALKPGMDRVDIKHQVEEILSTEKRDLLNFTDLDYCREHLLVQHVSRQVLGISLVMVNYWGNMPQNDTATVDQIKSYEKKYLEKCNDYLIMLRQIMFPHSLINMMNQHELKVRKMLTEKISLIENIMKYKTGEFSKYQEASIKLENAVKAVQDSPSSGEEETAVQSEPEISSG